MTANVSTENEQFIRQAIAEGRFANWDEAINQAVQILRDESSLGPHRVAKMDGGDQWASELRRWAAEHRRVESPVDFSRDSIYANCGE